MYFDVLFVIWNHSEPKVQRKFILAHKAFYEKGKEFLPKTKTKSVCSDARGDSNLHRSLLRSHDMIRKAYDTRNDFFKYKLKDLKLNNPKYWWFWGMTKIRFLHALWLENILRKNMIYGFLKLPSIPFMYFGFEDAEYRKCPDFSGHL